MPSSQLATLSVKIKQLASQYTARASNSFDLASVSSSIRLEAATAGALRTLALTVRPPLPAKLKLEYVLRPPEEIDSIKERFSVRAAMSPPCLLLRDRPLGNAPSEDLSRQPRLR